METKDLIRVGVAVALFAISLVISIYLVRIIEPLIFAGSIVVIAYYLFRFFAGRLEEGEKGILLDSVMKYIPSVKLAAVLLAVLSVVLSVGIVMVAGDLIKVIVTFVLAWLIYRWMLREFAGDISRELDEYLFGKS